jgi:hypothetical protein
VAAEMHEHWQGKHDQWKPMFGADLSDTRVDATPYDAPTLALAPSILALVALVGCLFPLRQAVRVDPVVALKHD